MKKTPLAIAGAALVVLAVGGAAFLLGRRAGPSAEPPGPPRVVSSAQAAAPGAAAPEAAAPGAAPAPAPRSAAKRRAPASDVVVEPVVVEKVDPQVPDLARRWKLHGTVVLRASISREGAVEEVEVVKGVHPLLDGAAQRAVARWKYRPGLVNGRPTPARLKVTVDFKA